MNTVRGPVSFYIIAASNPELKGWLKSFIGEVILAYFLYCKADFNAKVMDIENDSAKII